MIFVPVSVKKICPSGWIVIFELLINSPTKSMTGSCASNSQLGKIWEVAKGPLHRWVFNSCNPLKSGKFNAHLLSSLGQGTRNSETFSYFLNSSSDEEPNIKESPWLSATKSKRELSHRNEYADFHKWDATFQSRLRHRWHKCTLLSSLAFKL